MSTTRHPEPRAPRTLRVRGGRLAATVLAVAVAPLALAACGMLGASSNHGAAPVVIPTVDGNSAGANGTRADVTQQTTQVVVSGGVTITKTGLKVLTNTKTQIETSVKTQVSTQVNTKLVTGAPVTTTVTVTAPPVTTTVRETVTDKVTVTCLGTPLVCK